MRQIIFSFLAASMALSLHAEGYQINTLSTKQEGMGHTGVALKLGTESQFFNPAGMAFMNSTLSTSVSLTGVMATATCRLSGEEYKTDNKISTPISASTAFSIYDNIKAGIAFYTPYGSGINWGTSWPGAVLNQSVKLTAFTIQPTVAWRITPKLSIGAGAMITWGNVDLDKGLVSAESTDRLIGIMQMAGLTQTWPDPAYRFGTSTPASINLRGTAQAVVGINVGAMYDISDQWTVGVQYRSRMSMKVKKGSATVSYINELAQQLLGTRLNLINAANFEAEMPCPYVLTFGASFRPTSRLVLALDAQLTGWKTYRQLNINFLDEKVAEYNQHIEKNYSNSWSIKAGAQYAMTSRLDLRAGIVLDTTPVNDMFYNPETPGMTKINPSVGLSFQPVKGLSFDVAFIYVAGLGAKNASCTYPDLLAPVISSLAPSVELSPTSTFTADYDTHAFIPSIGISYNF